MLEKLAAIFSIGRKKWHKQIAAAFLTLILAVAGSFFTLNQPTFALPDIAPGDFPDIAPGDFPDIAPGDFPGGSTTSDSTSSTKGEGNCNDEIGAISWFVCPTTGAIAKAIDSVYGVLVGFLKVNPLTEDHTSPTYTIWEYAKSITNVVFVLLILIIIISQITGFGITSYGIKKSLPRIIVGAIMVNLSFLLCTILVDVSNILGYSIHNFFNSVAESIGNTDLGGLASISWDSIIGAILAGGTITAVAGVTVAGGIASLIWIVIPAILGAIVAIIAAVLTLAARQALITLLVMISPLAIVAYLLPNTENLFKKWRDLFTKLLVFFPTFSLLFGASALAGWAIISTSGGNGITLILGMAVQVFPLIFTPTLLKMSGTILGKLNEAVRKPFTPAQAALSKYASERRALASENHRAYGQSGSAAFRRYLYRQQQKRADDLKIASGQSANDAQAYSDNARNTFNGGVATTRTRRYKQYTQSNFEAQKSQLDLAHGMDTYGKRSTNAADKRLADTTTEAWAHSMLAQDRASNTARADIDHLANKIILEASKSGQGSAMYEKYIRPYGGELGELGENRLVQLAVDRSAKIEAEDKRMSGTLMGKFKFSKTQLRNMEAGYVVDDSGRAIDASGKVIAKDDPNRASKLQLIDPNTELELRDINDDKVTYRVKLTDKPMMKMLIESDLAINDPGWNKLVENMIIDQSPETINQGVMQSYRATITQSLLNANYAEHDATYSAMKAVQLKNGYIQNSVHNMIADVYSYARTAKADKAMINDSEAVQRQFAIATEDLNALSDANIDSYLDQNGASISAYEDDGVTLKSYTDTLFGRTYTGKRASIAKAQQKMRDNMLSYATSITPHIEGQQKRESAIAFINGLQSIDPAFAHKPRDAAGNFINPADAAEYQAKFNKIAKKAGFNT